MRTRSTVTQLLVPLATSLVLAAACGAGGEGAEVDDVIHATAGALSSPTATATAPTSAVLPQLTSTLTYLQSYADTRLVAGYKAEVLYSNSSLGTTNVFMRYTTNSWSSWSDVALKIDAPSSAHLHAAIAIPAGARSLEYAVYARAADGSLSWDNNQRRNFKVEVFPALADVTLVNGARRVRYVTRFTSCVLHYGTNGWTNVKETNMNFDSAALGSTGVRIYTSDVAGLGASDRLDFAFRTNEHEWDNNGGKDYFHRPGTISIDVWPNVDQAMNLLGENVTAYRNGKYYGVKPIESHHSGYYTYASFSGVEKGDWTFVLDVIKGGARTLGVSTFRADSPFAQASANTSLQVTTTPF